MSTDKNEKEQSNEVKEQLVKPVDTSIKITLHDFFCQLAEMSGGNDLSKTNSTKS
jgi:hypothetical protein